MTRHFQTHLYTFAVALTQGAAITPDNLAGMRAKAIRHGHTEGECLTVEANPARYIATGRLDGYGYELTPEGEQAVIPGCERTTSARAAQGELFGGASRDP